MNNQEVSGTGQHQSRVAPLTQYHRTYLPHFEAGETPQHICFRLADSIPRNLLEKWARESRPLSASQSDSIRRKRVEETLDKGLGACWLRRPDVASMVANALRHFAGKRYRLHAWVVMPNHVHILATPLCGATISAIVHSWKSYTASRANALICRQGPFWHPDYFDRFIRNEGHFLTAVEYIHQNPVKARLCRHPCDWKWSSAHRESSRKPVARKS